MVARKRLKGTLYLRYLYWVILNCNNKEYVSLLFNLIG